MNDLLEKTSHWLLVVIVSIGIMAGTTLLILMAIDYWLYGTNTCAAEKAQIVRTCTNALGEAKEELEAYTASSGTCNIQLQLSHMESEQCIEQRNNCYNEIRRKGGE